MKTRIAKRPVSDCDANLIFALYRDHLDAKDALNDVEREIFELLEKRDRILRELSKTSVTSIAETFELPVSTVYNMVVKLKKWSWEGRK